MEIGKGKTSSADDEGFIEVIKKTSCGNKGGNKLQTSLGETETHYHPKVNQSTEGASLKKTYSVGKKDVLTLSNGNFSLSKSFEALNVVNPVIEQVEMGNKASTSGVQEEGKCSTQLVEKINIIEKHLLKRKCVLVDDDGKPLEKYMLDLWSLVDYQKAAPKRATNNMEISKGKTSSADDEGFIEVIKKKSCGNKGGKKLQTSLGETKTHYHSKVNQSTEGASLKKTHSVGKKDVLTLSNGTFSLSKSFEALNVVNLVIEQVEIGNKASTSGVQEEGKRSTPLVEKINIIEKHLLKRKCVLVDDDGKPLEKVDYSGDQDKHQLKFNIHKDAKSLTEDIEKRFGGNKETKKRNKTNLEDQSLDDLFNSLKIYEAEVKSSSSTSPTTQNIAFVSSQNTDNTNESNSAVTSVSATSTKVHVSALPNVDTLSDVVIYSFCASQSNNPQLDNDDLKTPGIRRIKGGMFQWRLLLLMNWFHSVMVLEAMIGAFRQQKNQQTMPSWHSPPQVLQVLIMRKSQFDVFSYKTGLESVEARIVVYQQNETVFEEDIKLLKLDVMLRDNALVDLRKKFKKAKQERDELKLKLEKFQTSLKNLSQLLASQITDKTGLSYDTQVFDSTVFYSDELISSESDVSMLTSPVHYRYKSGERYHAVPPPSIGTFMPPKPDLVFHDAPTINETIPTAFNAVPSLTKPDMDLSQSNRPSAPITED
nr:hypothetical protein [Tanacetum cinerariifolium]